MSKALPSLFAPSIPYMAAIAGEPDVVIWGGERYVKQSYRNRADFLSSAGVFSFSIPIRKYPNPTPRIIDIHVSEHGQWRHKLRNALTSAYSSAPFWEHYEESIVSAIEYNDTDLLVDYNQRWINVLCEAWGLTAPRVTEWLDDSDDFHPEIGNNGCCVSGQNYLPRYWQVFEQKHGFTSGLSALDLLLTQGPEGRIYLLRLHEPL